MKSVTLKCKNCGKVKHTYAESDNYHIDCDCTYQKTGSKFRTTNIKSKVISVEELGK